MSKHFRAIRRRRSSLENLFKIKLRDYQKKVAACSNSRRIVLAARMTGKTDLIVAEATYRLLTESRKQILVTAPIKAMVTEVFNRVRRLLVDKNYYNAVTRDVSTPLHQIQLANGSSIIGISSRSSALCGRNAHYIYCDEAASYPEDFLIGSVFPVLQCCENSKILIVSSPSDRDRVFRKIYEENEYFTKFKWDYRTAGLFDAESLREYYNPREWSMDYECEWGDI